MRIIVWINNFRSSMHRRTAGIRRSSQLSGMPRGKKFPTAVPPGYTIVRRPGVHQGFKKGELGCTIFVYVRSSWKEAPWVQRNSMPESAQYAPTLWPTHRSIHLYTFEIISSDYLSTVVILLLHIWAAFEAIDLRPERWTRCQGGGHWSLRHLRKKRRHTVHVVAVNLKLIPGTVQLYRYFFEFTVL